ncbi:MAG: formate dehydrogenase subunit delta [Pseudomonadota bacterium]
MNIEHLVTMANDIAAFMNSEMGDKAPEGIASHIGRYWDPRMRTQIIAHVQSGGEGLNESAHAAILLLPPVAPRSV